jgi:hypothetical protein
MLDPELDPDPHHFVDDNPKCLEYEPILAPFQGFEGAFIWKLGSASCFRI